MEFPASDENDLVYPNLVNCQITVSNALVLANENSLPPPPPSFSTSNSEALLNHTSMPKYDFSLEKQILARNKERDKNSSVFKELEASDSVEQASVEVTLSDLKKSMK